MAQLTLNISDNQINFFLELIKKFDFVRVENKTTTVELTEEQKNILDERLKNYKNNPNSYIDMKDVKENLRMKYEL